ncbi:hypothetical protein [Paenibacillus sp. MMS18-CY102]|uniref:hypothetical protein n=1 Tax=Paenibacillus sp. MMS18-CY102 TaxID=2682849 RepID=UPI0013665316|nr:hypothetical protein [Paenibacillus sp. MMS18-CY102]MWC28011.1 hypothetical protein [Paenibacillus sp. MMS18-CY102]
MKRWKAFMLPLFLALLAVDFAWLILRLNGYDIAVFKQTGLLYPVIITFSILAIVGAFVSRRAFLATLLLSPFIAIALGILHFGSMALDWHYDELRSPDGSRTIIIEHRVATLGESNCFYQFNEVIFGGLLLRRLEGQDMYIMHRTSESGLVVLGAAKAIWDENKAVTFPSLDGPKRIILP